MRRTTAGRSGPATLLAALLVIGCDGGGGGTSAADGSAMADGGADAMAPGRDASSADAGPDAAPDASRDAAPDAGSDGAPADSAVPDATSPDAAPPACEFPAPRVGGTPEGDALAASPARCGQPDHAWIDGPALGDVVAFDAQSRIPAALLTTVLESQGAAIRRPFVYDAHLRQFAYTTQDRGTPIIATGVIAVPIGLPPDAGPPPIALVLHGTSGFNDTCAASDQLEWRALAAIFASFGYVTVAPDYIGLRAFGEPTGFLHPYLVGQPTAIASLDAVRAVGKMAAAGELGDLCPAPRVAVFGGSQGGHAALWVDRLAPYYAPELDIVGVVAAVPPADVLGQVERALTSLVDATGNTLAMLPTAGQWYGLGDRLDEVLVPEVQDVLLEGLAAPCGSDVDIDPDQYDELADVFAAPFLEAAAAGTLADYGPWGCMLAENGLTTTSIARISPDPASYGILFITGSDDELVHTPIERAAAETLCEAGVPLQYLECAGARHTLATFWALPELLDFFDARLAGEPFERPADCTPPPAVRCAGTPDDP